MKNSVINSSPKSGATPIGIDQAGRSDQTFRKVTLPQARKVAARTGRNLLSGRAGEGSR